MRADVPGLAGERLPADVPERLVPEGPVPRAPDDLVPDARDPADERVPEEPDRDPLPEDRVLPLREEELPDDLVPDAL